MKTISLLLLIGMATTYTAPDFHPLFCDRDGGLLYGLIGTPWVALDVSEYGNGSVECWDRILLTFEDGTQLVALALDAGPLYPYVIEGRGPIVADLPAHVAPFPGLSAPCTLVNLSAAARTGHALETQGPPHG